MAHETARGQRLQIMLSADELAILDNFRFNHRMPSRAAAIRELLRRGLLLHDGHEGVTGAKSKDFGVLDSEPDQPQASNESQRWPADKVESDND